MKIAYIFDRHVLDAETVGADKVFADDPETRRVEWAAMIDMGGLRAGDMPLLRSVGDLGCGAEANSMQRKIEALGVEIQVIPLATLPKAKTKVWLSPTDVQRERICTLWYSSLTPAHILQRAEDIMGRKVSRAQMNRMCGPRDGSR